MNIKLHIPYFNYNLHTVHNSQRNLKSTIGASRNFKRRLILHNQSSSFRKGGTIYKICGLNYHLKQKLGGVV